MLEPLAHGREGANPADHINTPYLASIPHVVAYHGKLAYTRLCAIAICAIGKSPAPHIAGRFTRPGLREFIWVVAVVEDLAWAQPGYAPAYVRCAVNVRKQLTEAT